MLPFQNALPWLPPVVRVKSPLQKALVFLAANAFVFGVRTTYSACPNAWAICLAAMTGRVKANLYLWK